MNHVIIVIVLGLIIIGLGYVYAQQLTCKSEDYEEQPEFKPKPSISTEGLIVIIIFICLVGAYVVFQVFSFFSHREQAKVEKTKIAAIQVANLKAHENRRRSQNWADVAKAELNRSFKSNQHHKSNHPKASRSKPRAVVVKPEPGILDKVAASLFGIGKEEEKISYTEGGCIQQPDNVIMDYNQFNMAMRNVNATTMMFNLGQKVGINNVLIHIHPKIFDIQPQYEFDEVKFNEIPTEIVQICGIFQYSEDGRSSHYMSFVIDKDAQTLFIINSIGSGGDFDRNSIDNIHEAFVSATPELDVYRLEYIYQPRDGIMQRLDAHCSAVSAYNALAFLNIGTVIYNVCLSKSQQVIAADSRKVANSNARHAGQSYYTNDEWEAITALRLLSDDRTAKYVNIDVYG